MVDRAGETNFTHGIFPIPFGKAPLEELDRAINAMRTSPEYVCVAAATEAFASLHILVFDLNPPSAR